MKKIKHYLIIGVEVVLFGIISASAASSNVPSYGVSYENSASNKNVSTVEAALNELYEGFSYGNVTAANMLSGKTALVNGSKVTGTMPNKGGTTQAGTGFAKTETGTVGESGYSATGSIKIPVSGYYDTDSTITFDLTDNNNSYYTVGDSSCKDKIDIDDLVIMSSGTGFTYVAEGPGRVTWSTGKNTIANQTPRWYAKINDTSYGSSGSEKFKKGDIIDIYIYGYWSSSVNLTCIPS